MMKKSDVKVQVRFRDIAQANYINAWDKFCDKYGYNYYCIREGRVESADTVAITLQDAEDWGLIQDD